MKKRKEKKKQYYHFLFPIKRSYYHPSQAQPRMTTVQNSKSNKTLSCFANDETLIPNPHWTKMSDFSSSGPKFRIFMISADRTMWNYNVRLNPK